MTQTQKQTREELEDSRIGWMIYGILLTICIILFFIFIIPERNNLQKENFALKEQIQSLQSNITITNIEKQNNFSHGIYCDNGKYLIRPYIKGTFNDNMMNYIQDYELNNLAMQMSWMNINCEVLP